MGVPTVGRSVRLVGRVRERRLLEDAIDRAAGQQPGAVFVHGEAGVGKTRLVADMRETAERRGYTVLWGSCVRFGAASAPYAPVVTALEHWLSRVAEDLPADVLAGFGDLGALLPSVERNTGAGAPPRLVPTIDKVITRICAYQPVVLVIDDLHWADVTSLEVLAYLVTGFHDQRLLLVTTSRDEEVGAGHPLHGWLADLRRLPAVDELHLPRFDRTDTEAQIAGLSGRTPDPALVEDVFARSAGNAYLTELLVRNLDPGMSRLPAGLPTALREALLAAWHRLSPDARRVLQLLAVGGRPLEFDALAAVAERQGISERVLSATISEAVASGVVVPGAAGEIWFRHPLLAEVLDATLLPGEAARLHKSFVRHLEARGTESEAGRMRHFADLALHHELAGHPAAAFGYSMRAAAAAATVQGFAEQARQLGRAIELWPLVPADVRETVGDLVTLLRQASDAANRAGEEGTAFAHIDRALQMVDREESPLLAASVLSVWSELFFDTGRATQYPLDRRREAVALTAGFPDSVEHVRALVLVAEAEAWRGDLAGTRRDADLGMAAAIRSGSDEAMVMALCARALAHVAEPAGLADAQRAFRLAIGSGDQLAVWSPSLQLSNALLIRGRLREAADVMLDGYQRGTHSKGGGYTAFLAAYAASVLLHLGDFDATRKLAREALALRATGVGGAAARLVATSLAVKVGRLDEAAQHLRRAEELVPSLEDHMGLEAPATYALYLIAAGRPDDAVRMLIRSLPAQAPDPRFCDQMLMWGARAAADLAERARDRHDESAAASAVSALDELVAARGTITGVPFEPLGPDDSHQPAFEAIFTAESARCRSGRSTAGPSKKAVGACAGSGLRWHEAVACNRLAEALLKDGESRAEVASVLRRAHGLATEMGADPVRDQAAALARIARVSLDVPEAPAPDDRPEGLPGVTRREREVLAHLVAGRSYSEIGAALFISDKTVSAHVSNLLRKTGTSNRHELSALARRLGVGAPRGG